MITQQAPSRATLYRRRLDLDDGPWSLHGLHLALLLACEAEADVESLARRTDREIGEVARAVALLHSHGLLEEVGGNGPPEAASANTDEDFLGPELFNHLERELARALGPMAAVVMGERVAARGIDLYHCTLAEFDELVEELGVLISHPVQAARFRAALRKRRPMPGRKKSKKKN